MDEQQGQPTPAGGVLTKVCLTCGQEYYLTAESAAGALVCEKCGGTVFRDFFTPPPGDDAAQDFADTTERDLDADDAEGDAMPGDVMDLDAG